ncbi:MAG: hypothetical protein ABS909_07930, partial [Arthrobacter sp.]
MPQGLRSQAAGAVLVLAAAAVCAGLLALALTLAPRDGIDFRVYVAGGQTVLKASGELYSVGIPNPPNPELMFTYPPAAALLFAVLAPFGDVVGFNIFFSISLLLTALTALWLVSFFSGAGSVRAVLKGFWLRPAVLV